MPLESYYDDKWFKNRLKKITEDTEFTEEFSTQVEFLIDCYLSDILTDVANRYSSSPEEFPEKLRIQEEKTAAIRNELHHLKKAYIEAESEKPRHPVLSRELHKALPLHQRKGEDLLGTLSGRLYQRSRELSVPIRAPRA